MPTEEVIETEATVEQPEPVAAEPVSRPSADDCRWAMLSYALKCVAPIAAPFAIYCWKKGSPFVARHAMQSLFLDLGFIVVTAGALVTAYVLQLIPFAGWVMAYLLQAAPFVSMMFWLVSSVLCAVRAVNGRECSVPMVGDLAEGYMGD